MKKNDAVVIFKFVAPNIVNEKWSMKRSFEKVMTKKEADDESLLWENSGTTTITEVTNKNRELAIALLNEECDQLEGSMEQFELVGMHNDAISYLSLIEDKKSLLKRISN